MREIKMIDFLVSFLNIKYKGCLLCPTRVSMKITPFFGYLVFYYDFTDSARLRV